MNTLSLLLALGCHPSHDVPRRAEDARVDWFVLRLGDVAVGSEARHWTEDGNGRTVWRVHHYPWRYDGTSAPVERTTTVRMNADGAAIALWREGATEPWWTGRGVLPELAVWQGQLTPGPVELLDPVSGRVESTQITLDRDGHLSWHVAGLDGWAGPEGVVRSGPLSVVPWPAGKPEIAPVDPAALVRRSVPAVDVVRPVHAVFDLDGVHRSVSAPLPLEVPSAFRTQNEALVQQVREALTHAPTPGRVGLKAALRDGLGDCNEMAELYVTLARKRGWVVRPVAGVAYVAEPEPSMALHAWAEVWLDGRWIGVDPALDQPLADATHLVLASDEELWQAMVRLVAIESLGIVTIR